MKRFLLTAGLLSTLMFASSASGQIVDTTVCDVLANPSSFDGKIVRIKATVFAGFDEFAIKDSNCNNPVNAIWLAYPEGTKGKASPVAFLQIQLAKNNRASVTGIPRTPVKLDAGKDFKQFDSLLSTPGKLHGLCLGCVRYTVSATLVGRLDGTNSPGLVHDDAGKATALTGFGNANRYSARLVLQSVSDITPHEIDYSSATAAANDDSSRNAAGGDPVAAAHQVARAFGAGSPAADQVEAAAAAYGKEGEDNGVEIGFGAPNEVPKNDSSKGDKNSPDGILFNCTFDMDRLKGAGLTIAIAHVGTHIADLRSSQQTGVVGNAYDSEFHAWQTTILSAMGNRLNTLTLPGSVMVWNSTWPPADRTKMVTYGIAKFLADWVSLNPPARP